MLYAGLDIHKNFCHAVVCAKDGSVVKEERIKTDREELSEFFSRTEEVKIAIEATTNYEYFFDSLEGDRRIVVLSHPLKTRAIAEARIKTDKISANILADLLRANILPTSGAGLESTVS